MNRAEPADRIAVGDLEIRFLIESNDANGALTMFECRVPVNARMPAPHSHDAFDETIYGLEGVCTWTVDGRTRDIGADDALCVLRGSIHGFANVGSTEARFLAIATPGVFGPAYFEEIGEVLARADGPPDHAAIAQVMRRHGLTPAPPTNHR